MTTEKQNETLSKLNQLHKRATAVLFTCNTMFPFDLFPDTLIIDYNKIDIIYRRFFANAHTISIPIEQLNYVGVESVLFLSTLKLEAKGLEQNPEAIVSLRTKDAQTAKNLIFGLMTAEKHNIDLMDLPKEAIIDKLIEIGRAE